MRLAAERPLSTTKVRILLYAAVVLFGTEFATPALAQTFPMSITCTSFGETCTPAFSTPVTVASPGPLTITVTASPTHCSNVGYTVSVDGTAITTTPFLTPGQTSAAIVTGSLSAGPHTIAVQGIGTVGGCNGGNLLNWSGTLVVSSAAIPATPAPTTLLLTLTGLLVISMVYLKHRRVSIQL